MRKQFYSDKALAEKYEVSRATIWRWAKTGILPEPVVISPGCTRWDSEKVDERDRARDMVAA